MGSTIEDGILKGPSLGPVPQCSWSEYMLPKLRSLPEDKILQVEAETGVTQTTKQLLTASIRLAEGFTKMGLGENDVVGMLCRNSIDACNIVLATWLCGATTAPMNGSMKTLELKHILGVTKPKIVFCEEHMIETVRSALNLLSNNATIFVAGSKPNPSCGYRTIEEIPVDTDIENYKPRPIRTPSTQLVAIMPSSGTSGLSKGVGLTHTNLIYQDMNLDTLSIFPIDKDFLQVSHFYWVTGVLVFMKTLTKGMKRILVKDTSELNILKTIDKYKPGWTLMAPLSLLSITNHPQFEEYDVSSLKHLLVGGSTLTRFVGKKLQEMWPKAKFVQGYGTTETSGVATTTDENGDLFSVGTVTPGVQLKICDLETNEIQRAHGRGEIRLNSPGKMKCYVGNEEATKNAVDETGWIRTGDLGYYDDSGQVFLVDRIKDMIKVRNLQIAPGEIENVIMAIPGVLEAGVTAVAPEGEFDRILAIVSKDPAVPLTEEDIHSHVESNLSDFKKLTGGVYFVESVPKTPTGKIQRGELKRVAELFFSKRYKNKAI